MENKELKIKKVTYSATGEHHSKYTSESVALEVELDGEQDWKTVLEELKTRVHEQLNDLPAYRKMQDETNSLKQELRSIRGKVNGAKKTWETVSSFIVAQGIKTDVDKFPDQLYLPSASDTMPEAYDAEIEEEADYEAQEF